MLRLLAPLIALAGLIAAGLAHRSWSEQLEGSSELQEAISRVARVPLALGDWLGRDEAADELSFARAGAKSYWMRTYTNARKKTSVLAILMAGPAKGMAVHTPEVCYQGAGFHLAEGPQAFALVGDAAETPSRFWTGKFRREGTQGADLRLFWAWNSGQGWLAPADPRSEFRGQPFLYKLYVSHEQGSSAPTLVAHDPAAEFLKVLLPELSRTLLTEKK